MKTYKKCASYLFSLIFLTVIGASLSTPASAVPSLSFVAGTSAGWDFHELAGDIARNNTVDVNDLGVLAQHWLASGCADANQWCSGTDLDASSGVGFLDYAIMAGNWGKQAAWNVVLQTIYGTAQDANGTITANTVRALSQGKGMAMAFAVPQNIALDKGIFKLAGLAIQASNMQVRMYNVTGKGYLTNGHTVSKSDPGAGSTALININVAIPIPAPYHLEGAAKFTDMIIDFGNLEITAGEYLIVFDAVSGSNTACSMVKGTGVTDPVNMGKYPDGMPLPKRATVTTSTFSGNTYYYYLSASTKTSYSVASDLFAFQITLANHPPVANAGPDQTIQYPAVANLSGTVSDDGFPDPPGALTMTWSQVSGPGTVTFGDIHALNTTATFSDFGTYVLRLTASDGVSSTSDDVTILSTDNSPPVVDAGSDRTIGILDAPRLSGIVTDDGLPNPPGALTTQWTVISGPGTVTFSDVNNVNATVSFSGLGDYVLRLTANDSLFSSYDELTCTVVDGSLNAAPDVNAGPDVAIGAPSNVAAALNGTATDDGLPNPPGALTLTWTQQSGPGTVTFADIHSASTTATADNTGTYVLRLTASDGTLESYDEMTVTWKGLYEGYEPIATGGAGGAIVHVTNLNDSGAGSFRAAATGGGNRTIVFDVGGTICVSDEIRISNENITVDGSTAPPPGITLVGGGFYAVLGINVSDVSGNVIISHIRIRNSGKEDLQIWGGGKIVIDHCSMTGSLDGALDINAANHVVISRCLFGGDTEVHKAHGTYISAHHNLYSTCNRRQPRIFQAGPYWDFRNNVLDNWTNTGTNILYSDSVNIVNNWYGNPNSMSSCSLCFYPLTYDTNVYINGNYSACGKDIDGLTQLSTPNLEPNVTTIDAGSVPANVLADVGAQPTDAIDQYYIDGGGTNPPAIAACGGGASGGGSGGEATILSEDTKDGYVLESAQGSGVGGSVSTGSTFIGDDNGGRQYVAILSFDTSSIPLHSTITSATLTITRLGAKGTASDLGTLTADIKEGTYGSVNLQTTDFEAASSATNVVTIPLPTGNGRASSGDLNSTGISHINIGGYTQFKLHFALKTNGDTTDDYLQIYDSINNASLDVVWQ